MMYVRILTVITAFSLLALVVCVQDESSADTQTFGLYERGTQQEQAYSGPLINTMADFTVVGDSTVVLDSGFVLSDAAYMRLSTSADCKYSLDITVSGITGFLGITGISFEFYNGGTKVLSIPVSGTAGTGYVFSSGVNYDILIVTSNDLCIDHYPAAEDGVSISFEVDVQMPPSGGNAQPSTNPSSEPSTPTSDPSSQTTDPTPSVDPSSDTSSDVTVHDDGPQNILLESSFSRSDLDGMMQGKDTITVNGGDYVLTFDAKASEFIASNMGDSVSVKVTLLDSEGGEIRYDISVQSDSERMTSFGGGKVTVSLKLDREFAGFDSYHMDQEGNILRCQNRYDREDGTLSLTCDQCHVFIVEPVSEPSAGTDDVQNASEEKHDDTGPVFAVTIAVVLAMAMVPLLLRWRGKI